MSCCGECDRPICLTCGRPMRRETWRLGTEVWRYWLCLTCKYRVAAEDVDEIVGLSGVEADRTGHVVPMKLSR